MPNRRIDPRAKSSRPPAGHALPDTKPVERPGGLTSCDHFSAKSFPEEPQAGGGPGGALGPKPEGN